MINTEKIVPSMMLSYLKSLKMDQFSSEPVLECDPEASVVITGINENVYNTVILQSPTDNEQLIEELRALQQKIMLPLTVFVADETNASTTGTILKENFESPGAFYGMLLDVNQANLSPSANITIEQVENSKQAEEYAQIFSEIFNFPNLLQRTISWAVEQYESSNPSGISYLAKINGTPVGTCSLMLDNNFKDCRTGGLYNACVLPEFRNMGVGTAMACHRVNVAKSIGLNHISILLMSNAMAKGYCERLGFTNSGTLTPYYI